MDFMSEFGGITNEDAEKIKGSFAVARDLAEKVILKEKSKNKV